jgi:hypothetical protein
MMQYTMLTPGVVVQKTLLSEGIEVFFIGRITGTACLRWIFDQLVFPEHIFYNRPHHGMVLICPFTNNRKYLPYLFQAET